MLSAPPQTTPPTPTNIAQQHLGTLLFAGIIVILWVVIGAGVGIGLYFSLQQQFKEKLYSDLEQKSIQFRNSFYNVLDKVDRTTTAMAAYLSLYHQNMTYYEFANMVVRSKSMFPGLSSWTYAKLVNASQRNYEVNYLKQFFPEFYIRDFDSNGTSIPTPNTYDYVVPITYVAPLESNRVALGYNLVCSLPTDRISAPVYDAIRKRRAVASGRTPLFEDQTLAVIITVPVFQQVNVNNNVTSNNIVLQDGNVAGVIRPILRISTLVENGTVRPNPEQVALRLYDLTQPNPDERFLYSSVPSEKELTFNQLSALQQQPNTFSTVVTIASREWVVIFSALTLDYSNAPLYSLIFSLGIAFFIGLSSAIVIILICGHRYQIDQRRSLLYSIMPKPIARRIMNGEKHIAQKQKNVSLLFMDVCGFTTFVANTSNAMDLVHFLSEFTLKVDTLIEQFGLEKIKMIGDCFFVAGNASNNAYQEKASDMAGFALRALQDLQQVKMADKPVNVRIGIHMGDVVMGVIGKLQTQYDVWGDAVNTAARLESNGLPNHIHVSQSFADAVQDNYVLQMRGDIQLKGLGSMTTSFLVAKK